MGKVQKPPAKTTTKDKTNNPTVFIFNPLVLETKDENNKFMLKDYDHPPRKQKGITCLDHSGHTKNSYLAA
jgi:hypothetical protein